MSIHDNSRDANDAGNDGPFGKRAKSILAVFESSRRLSVPMSDREVMLILGFTDMNSVRPRITELIKRGVLVECGSIVDVVTGMTVRISRLAKKQGQLF